MRMTTRGRVTIPAAIRKKTGLLPHTDVEFSYEPDGSISMWAKDKRPSSTERPSGKEQRGKREMTTGGLVAPLRKK